MNAYQSIVIKKWLHLSSEAAKKPVLLVVGSCLIVAILMALSTYAPALFGSNKELIIEWLFSFLRITFLAALFWFVFRTLNIIQSETQHWINTANHKTLRIIAPMINDSLKAAIMLLMITMIIPELDLSGFKTEVLEKLFQVLLISVLGWTFIQIINGFEKLLLYQYASDKASEMTARKVRTQIHLLKKIIFTISLIIIFAAILMVFDSVKKLGAGLLTTAGLLSVVGAFASQKSLNRLFAGLQIAFAQPIRIGDTVVIENELGEIEEISLSYVIVKIWDLRRLVLPTDYFTEKGFQNLTRTSAEILGTVFIYVDHSFPVETLREKFNQIITNSPAWDHKIGILQVSDMKEFSTELRALVSAKNVGTLWNLRCEIREGLIKFIADHHADYFPQRRNLNRST